MSRLFETFDFPNFPLTEEISESHCSAHQTSVGRCRQKTRCFPNEAGIAAHQLSLKLKEGEEDQSLSICQFVARVELSGLEVLPRLH